MTNLHLKHIFPIWDHYLCMDLRESQLLDNLASLGVLTNYFSEKMIKASCVRKCTAGHPLRVKLPCLCFIFLKKELWRKEVQSNFTLKAWNQSLLYKLQRGLSLTINKLCLTIVHGLPKILMLWKLEHMIRSETEGSGLFRSDVALLIQYICVSLSLFCID